MSEEVLSARHVLEFPYTRSTGEITGRYLAGLQQGRILGIRDTQDRVVVPAQEYDPNNATGLGPDRLVEVGTSGEVVSWSWNSRPRMAQPLAHPFAWALVKLDGADTPLLAAVDAGSPDAMSTGMRVTARWADEPRGHVSDLVCFDPGEGPTNDSEEIPAESAGVVESPIRLEYDYTPGRAQSRYLRAVSEGRIVGHRCPSCEKVYVPARGACPMCGELFGDETIDIAQKGTLVTYSVTHVPSRNIKLELPYVGAEVLLDGADTTSSFLMKGVKPEEVRVGMRVELVWKPEEEWGITAANIEYCVPIDEPDVPYEQIEEHT